MVEKTETNIPFQNAHRKKYEKMFVNMVIIFNVLFRNIVFKSKFFLNEEVLTILIFNCMNLFYNVI